MLEVRAMAARGILTSMAIDDTAEVEAGRNSRAGVGAVPSMQPVAATARRTDPTEECGGLSHTCTACSQRRIVAACRKLTRWRLRFPPGCRLANRYPPRLPHHGCRPARRPPPRRLPFQPRHSLSRCLPRLGWELPHSVRWRTAGTRNHQRGTVRSSCPFQAAPYRSVRSARLRIRRAAATQTTIRVA